MSKLTGTEILSRLARGQPMPPVLVLTGPELYTKERIVQKLVARLVGEGLEAFNVTKLRGSEIQWGDVAGIARTLPMMADRRLVLLSELQDVRDKAPEPLLDYLKDPNPSTCLVADTEGSDLRRQPQLTLSRTGTVVVCQALEPRDAVVFVEGYAKERGAAVDREAAALLVERAGVDMTWLSGEVDRLLLYVHPETRVSAEVVARVVGRSRQLSVFEYVGALSRRDLHGAVRLLRELVADGEAPLGVLALIERQFRMMLACAEERARGAAPRDACRAASVPPFIESRFLDELKAWRLPVLRASLPLFLRKDLDMKSRGVSHLTELELLSAELLAL